MRLPGILAALVFMAAATFPQLALAASTFYGEVVHVSVENIKVYDPKTKQTLSFVLTPKFDQVFSANGKTTYQMKNVKKGQYVGVIYDQKALGMRHADKIYILTNRNQKISAQ
jgi:hypothetical protein